MMSKQYSSEVKESSFSFLFLKENMLIAKEIQDTKVDLPCHSTLQR